VVRRLERVKISLFSSFQRGGQREGHSCWSRRWRLLPVTRGGKNIGDSYQNKMRQACPSATQKKRKRGSPFAGSAASLSVISSVSKFDVVVHRRWNLGEKGKSHHRNSSKSPDIRNRTNRSSEGKKKKEKKKVSNLPLFFREQGGGKRAHSGRHPIFNPPAPKKREKGGKHY